MHVLWYNSDSIWLSLYVAYYLRFINPSAAELTEDNVKGKSVDEIFRRSTDGSNCPMARCWTPDEFIDMCAGAGFVAEYQGVIQTV